MNVRRHADGIFHDQRPFAFLCPFTGIGIPRQALIRRNGHGRHQPPTVLEHHVAVDGRYAGGWGDGHAVDLKRCARSDGQFIQRKRSSYPDRSVGNGQCANLCLIRDAERSRADLEHGDIVVNAAFEETVRVPFAENDPAPRVAGQRHAVGPSLRQKRIEMLLCRSYV